MIATPFPLCFPSAPDNCFGKSIPASKNIVRRKQSRTQGRQQDPFPRNAFGTRPPRRARAAPCRSGDDVILCQISRPPSPSHIRICIVHFRCRLGSHCTSFGMRLPLLSLTSSRRAVRYISIELNRIEPLPSVGKVLGVEQVHLASPSNLSDRASWSIRLYLWK